MKDLLNNLHPMVVAAPAILSDNTAVTSSVVDLVGFDSLLFVIATGTLADADATFDVVVKEGDTDTQADHTEVADVDLIGTEVLAGFDQDADNACRKIGYKGGKRYVSIEITPDGNAADAPIAVLAILGHPGTAPTANPPE